MCKPNANRHGLKIEAQRFIGSDHGFLDISFAPMNKRSARDSCEKGRWTGVIVDGDFDYPGGHQAISFGDALSLAHRRLLKSENIEPMHSTGHGGPTSIAKHLSDHSAFVNVPATASPKPKKNGRDRANRCRNLLRA